jgi:hypothetical protein
MGALPDFSVEKLGWRVHANRLRELRDGATR